jgi:hypothetical protein
MLTLLCRDIRVFDWIGDVRKVSSGIIISSWCIVVHILREYSAQVMWYYSLCRPAKLLSIMTAYVSTGTSFTLRAQYLLPQLYDTLRYIGSFIICRGRRLTAQTLNTVAHVYRLLTLDLQWLSAHTDPLELMHSFHYFLPLSVILLVPLYVSVIVSIWPEYSNSQYRVMSRLSCVDRCRPMLHV